jgi:hypothetical protein
MGRLIGNHIRGALAPGGGAVHSINSGHSLQGYISALKKRLDLEEAEGSTGRDPARASHRQWLAAPTYSNTKIASRVLATLQLASRTGMAPRTLKLFRSADASPLTAKARAPQPGANTEASPL